MADGDGVVVELVGSVRTAVSTKGSPPGAAVASLAARRAASFDVWAAFWRTRALWGSVSVEIRRNAVDKRRIRAR